MLSSKVAENPTHLKVIDLPDHERQTASVEEIEVLDYFLRDELDESRVQYFVDLIEDGHKLPAVKIGIAKDVKKLIDGRHRLEAHRQCGISKIEYIQSKNPAKLWILEAIQLNSKSAKPLTRGEFSNAVKRASEQGLTIEEIYKQLSGCCSERHLHRLLQPMKKHQKIIRDERVLELKDQGKTRNQIATEMQINPETVKKILQRKRNEEKGENNWQKKIDEYKSHIKALLPQVKESELSAAVCCYFIQKNKPIGEVVDFTRLHRHTVIAIAVAVLYILQNPDMDQEQMEDQMPEAEGFSSFLIYMCNYLTKNIPDQQRLCEWIKINCRHLLSTKQKRIVLLEAARSTSGQSPEQTHAATHSKESLERFFYQSSEYIRVLQKLTDSIKCPGSVDSPTALKIAERVNQSRIFENHLMDNLKPQIG